MDIVTDLAAKAAENRLKMLEQLGAAYCLKTGIPPDECELVEQHAPTGMTWFFRRREQTACAPPMTEREEQLTVQLAGVSVAANGGTKEPCVKGQWGWSVAYQDTLELRLKYDALLESLSPLCHAEADKPLTTGYVMTSRSSDRPKASTSALQRAAQAWCGSETRNMVMIPELAEEFAKIIDTERSARVSDAEIDRIAERIVQKMDDRIMSPCIMMEPTCDCGPPSSFTATIRPMTEEEKAACPLTNHGPCAVCSKDVIHTYPWWTARPDKPDAKPVHDECVRTLGVATREQPNCARCGAKHAWRGNPDGHEPGCEYSMPSAAQPANLPVDPKRTVCVCPRELVFSRGCQCGGK